MVELRMNAAIRTWRVVYANGSRATVKALDYFGARHRAARISSKPIVDLALSDALPDAQRAQAIAAVRALQALS